MLAIQFGGSLRLCKPARWFPNMASHTNSSVALCDVGAVVVTEAAPSTVLLFGGDDAEVTRANSVYAPFYREGPNEVGNLTYFTVRAADFCAWVVHVLQMPAQGPVPWQLPLIFEFPTPVTKVAAHGSCLFVLLGTDDCFSLFVFCVLIACLCRGRESLAARRALCGGQQFKGLG